MFEHVYGGSVADSNAAKKVKQEEASESSTQDSSQAKDRRSMILMILVVVNSLAFAGVGFGLYQYSKATREVVKSATEISEVKEQPSADKKKATDLELKLVALETFYVNLDGSEGYKLLKVTMSLEVDSVPAQDEILKRQAQVRDMIIILLTSKRYGEVSGENA